VKTIMKREKRRKVSEVFLMAVMCSVMWVEAAFATWTPLITADDFTGPQTDVLTCAGGVITLILVISVIGYLAGVIRR
jgi:hypothetical protein